MGSLDHPSKFQHGCCSNVKQIAFRMNLGLLTQLWNCFHHSPSIARISSHRRLGFFLSLLVSVVASQEVLSYSCEGFVFPMRSIPNDRTFDAIALLQHGHSTREVSELLGISQTLFLGFVESMFFMWSLEEEGVQETSPYSAASVCTSHHNWWTR